MAAVTPNKEETAGLGVWKPFLTLMTSVKIPWGWVLLAFAVYMTHAQIQLMIPDVTAKIMAGDIRLGVILFMLGCTFLSALLTAVQQTVSRVCAGKTAARFQKFMIQKTLSLPVPFYDKNMANRLITRTTSDSTQISEFFGYSIPCIPSTVYSFVGAVVIVGRYSWYLVGLMAVMIPIILLVTFLSGRMRYTWNNRFQIKLAELGGYLSEALTNIPLIKVFVKEKAEEENGRRAIGQIYETKKKFLWVTGLLGFLSSAEGLVQTLVVVLGGGYLVNRGYVTVAQWIAFYGYASMLTGSFQSVLRYYETVKAAQGSARRMAEIAAEASEDTGGNREMPDQPGEVRFENVTFRYDQDTVLKNVSFTIPAGKTTALVGPSGAGKSTILGLLERFYDPESGCVTLDGVDAREFRKSAWRQAIGYVPQSSPMFSGTIRSNMTYGLNRPVTEDELVQAAREANIYDFIRSCDRGFDTDVGERGCKLSGGQRQRVAIARALLKNPQILLLDEATSSLDPEARDEVDKAIRRLKQGRTTVIVAHALKSVEDADQIIVLSAGAVSGVGTDRQLMQGNDLYRSLKTAQSCTAVPGNG